MNKDIKVSIITVCYNSSNTIIDTFESMLKQTYKNIEYIVVDGKSTDDTIKIIRKYEKKFDFEFKYISEKDNGIYDAMNKGINMATGEIIGMINSDDFYEPNAIQDIVNAYDNKKYEILYGMMRKIKNGKELDVSIKSHEFLPEQMINHPTCFVTKDIYNDFGKFDTNYKSSADYALMLQYFYNKDITFKPVYKIIANFRCGGMSSSQTGYRETLKLKLKYNIIGKKEYYYKKIKSHLYELIK